MSDGFEKFEEFLSGAQKRISSGMERSLERSGEIVRKNIVKGIRSQEFNFAPLKDSTLAAKSKTRKRSGHMIPAGSNLVLIDQGDYLSSITSVRKDDEVMIGTNHPQARRLELGFETTGQEARPHFEPGLKMSEDEYREELMTSLQECFRFDT
jgi:phage gpG-like protein